MTVGEKIAQLGDLDLAGLRSFWQAHFGSPPRHRSTDLIRRHLAWRLQADLHGGLPATVLEAVAAKPKPAKAGAFAVGTKLTRDWKGQRHEVLVTSEGFEHDGQTYGSLSEVARAIAGSRWNGPRFFGLRQ